MNLRSQILRHIVAFAFIATASACSKSPESPANPPPVANAPASAPADVPAGAYTLDKYHASLNFRVNHLGFSRYTAKFSTFDAQLQFDPHNLAASSLAATVDAGSLTLDNPPPGFTEELLNAQWLDAKQFPKMTYQSTKVEALSATTARVTGDFTMRGITKPLVLEATFNGGYVGHPMDPHARIGFSAHGTLKRSEYGIAFGIPAPGTTMGVSDAVDVMIEVEFSGPPLVQNTENVEKK